MSSVVSSTYKRAHVPRFFVFAAVSASHAFVLSDQVIALLRLLISVFSFLLYKLLPLLLCKPPSSFLPQLVVWHSCPFPCGAPHDALLLDLHLFSAHAIKNSHESVQTSASFCFGPIRSSSHTPQAINNGHTVGMDDSATACE